MDKEYNYKVKLELSYDGTSYGGWQRQKQGPPTIQGTIEAALSKIIDEPITICGAGRTDAGVHAEGQVAHFWTSKEPSRFNLTRSLNSLTPWDITLKNAWKVSEDFHAIATSKRKHYRYQLLNSSLPSALHHRYYHWVRSPLNIDYLNEVSAHLIGKMDFKSFQTSGTDLANTVREIFQSSWHSPRPGILFYSITGSGFLKQMVRNIVGTQLDLCLSGASPGEILTILEHKDRRFAKTAAPPQGLYLASIEYPLDKKCLKI